MKLSGINMGEVKRQNQMAVLKYMNMVGAVSRKDIATATNLTPAAVTQITTELLSRGVLYETGEQVLSEGAGRRKVLIDINRNLYYILGINIGVSNTVIALCNMAGDELSTLRIPTDREAAARDFLDVISDKARELIEKHSDIKEKVAGISVCVPGIVDKAAGVSKKAYGLWNEPVPVCEILEQAFGLPVIIENDVKAFAIAESIMGWGKEYSNLFIVKWGPLVGSAIIVDGSVYEGIKEQADELGHFIVEKKGKTCVCGKKGCLETRVGYRAMKEITPFKQDELADCYFGLTDSKTKAQFDDAFETLAMTIVGSISVTAPHKLILSGKFFEDERMRNRILELCREYDPGMEEDRILYTMLGDREDYVGTIAAFLYRRLFA